MKSGSLNLLETSGPHRACYGTALPLPFTIQFVIWTTVACNVLFHAWIFHIIWGYKYAIYYSAKHRKDGYRDCHTRGLVENTGDVLYSRECSWPSRRRYSPCTVAKTVEEKTYRFCQKQESVSLRDLLSSGHHFKMFRWAYHCQGQPKSPQSISVLFLRNVAYSRYDAIYKMLQISLMYLAFLYR